MKCDLCDGDIEVVGTWEKGHNPAPLGKKGDRCCQWCNDNLVVPLRIRQIQERHKEDTNEQ